MILHACLKGGGVVRAVKLCALWISVKCRLHTRRAWCAIFPVYGAAFLYSAGVSQAWPYQPLTRAPSSPSWAGALQYDMWHTDSGVYSKCQVAACTIRQHRSTPTHKLGSPLSLAWPFAQSCSACCMSACRSPTLQNLFV